MIILREGCDPWFLLEISDEHCLIGSSVAKFVRVVLDLKAIEFAICYDVLGADVSLASSQSVTLKISEFEERVGDAIQYDWAFFFLFQNRPMIDFVSDRFLDDALNLADVTIRLVDDEYFYVYSRDQILRQALSSRFPASVCTNLSPGEIKIPF